MEFECIIYEKKDPIATIKFNRPKVLNAVNRQMRLEIETALDDAENDAAVKALIFTGEGRAFSSGDDLKETTHGSLEDYRSAVERQQETARRIIRFEKPTVAAINGYALGGGFELALACDIRIAAADAQIGSPESKANSSVAGGLLQLIQELVGPAKAAELLFTGESVTGREAERIGLVNRAVAGNELMNAATQMAAKIAVNSSIAIKLMKRGLGMARSAPNLEALMSYEVEARLACMVQGQGQGSVEDFEKRKKK